MATRILPSTGLFPRFGPITAHEHHAVTRHRVQASSIRHRQSDGLFPRLSPIRASKDPFFRGSE